MQADPDQHAWLLQEEQERLRWKQKLARPPRTRPQWVLAAVAGVILVVVVVALISSDTFGELIAQVQR
jgi:hypothetical protein